MKLVVTAVLALTIGGIGGYLFGVNSSARDFTQTVAGRDLHNFTELVELVELIEDSSSDNAAKEKLRNSLLRQAVSVTSTNFQVNQLRGGELVGLCALISYAKTPSAFGNSADAELVQMVLLSLKAMEQEAIAAVQERRNVMPAGTCGVV